MTDSPYRNDEVQTPKLMGDMLKNRLQKKPLEKKVVRIHTEAHDLAEQISKAFNEPKKFGMWLGIIKKHGVRKVYQAWAEVRQSKSTRPVLLLMWKLSKKADDLKRNSEPGIPGGSPKRKDNHPDKPTH